jgi:pimeloyl-ACP methyl ester carboxylesterase
MASSSPEDSPAPPWKVEHSVQETAPGVHIYYELYTYEPRFVYPKAGGAVSGCVAPAPHARAQAFPLHLPLRCTCRPPRRACASLSLTLCTHTPCPLTPNTNSKKLEQQQQQQPPARVLLIMGVSATAVAWHTQITALLARAAALGRPLQVLAYDNRGVGRSTAPRDRREYGSAVMAADAAALMDAVGWPAAHVVGFSMGSQIAGALRVRCVTGRGVKRARFL